MDRLSFAASLFAISLLATAGVCGQTQQPTGKRAVEAASTLLRSVEGALPAGSSSGAAGAQVVVPRLMKFSGSLHDAAGKPLTGTVDVTFSLYGNEKGGDALWFETQSVQADELGRYTALLGAMHSDGLPTELFTSGEVRWLGIQVGSNTEQQPRVLLVSVPYALKAGDAETLGGKPASAYMLSDSQKETTSTTSVVLAPTGSTQTSTTNSTQNTPTGSASAPLAACANVTSDGTAAANSIALFTTACNLQSSAITQVGGNLGFGVAVPQARLHIYGPSQINGDARYNFILGDSTPAAAGVGGGILFSGFYKSTTNKAGFAAIRGVKENDVPGNFASALIFSTQVNGGAQVEKLRITSNGSVGIGTSTPTALLEVNGTSQFDGLVTFSAGQSVTGNITATGTISGNGSGLTSVAATSAATATLASTATNALALGGVAASGYATLGANAFTASQTIGTGNLTISSGTLSLPQTTDASTGVVLLGGNPFIHACCADSGNVFMGVNAGNFTTTGIENVAVGDEAFTAITTGDYNTAVGGYTLYTTSGSENTALGFSALTYDTTGNANTAIGFNSLQANDTGTFNTAVGDCALANTEVAGVNPTGCGSAALTAAVGNTALGASAGQTNVTGKGNTFAGYLADASADNLANATAIGANALVSASNSLVLGSINGVNGAGASVKVGIGTSSPAHTLDVVGDINISGCYLFSGSGTYGNCASDRRLKTDIQPFAPVLDRMVQLQPVHFNWKSSNPPEYRYGSGPAMGLIAQEVQQVFPEMVRMDANGYRRVNYSELPLLLLEGVRELKAENDSLKNSGAKLLDIIKAQQAQLQMQQEQIAQLASKVTVIQASLKVRQRTDRTIRVTRTVDEKTAPRNASNPTTMRGQ